MLLAKRALRVGFIFGTAVATVDLGGVGMGQVVRRMGPGTPFLLETIALDMLLAVALAVVGMPLLRLRVGRFSGAAFLLVWIASAWFALGWFAPFDTPMAAMLEAVPFAALLLASLGYAVARFSRGLAWGLAVALLLAALFGPRAYVDATAEPLPSHEPLVAAAVGAPDVVLIVLDTVRAENVSTYGYARATAPTIAELASEGVTFEDATSPSTWSLPSHASLFTGRYPSSHGAHGEHVVLDDRFPTLAEVLLARGYETFCFTANPWISDGLGLTRGFGTQDQSAGAGGGAGRNFVFVHRLVDRLGFRASDKGGALVAEHFAGWAEARPTDARPAFVFMNFIEAHFPYHQLPDSYAMRYTDRPPAELTEISMALMAQQFGGEPQAVERVRAPAVDMYDGGIDYSDELLRRVVEAVRKRGKLDDTVFVVMADHGELMGEKGQHFGHGPSLYQPAISVPLVVRYPPRLPAGTRVETPVSTLSVFGTILDLAEIEAPPTLQARSLVPLVASSQRPGEPAELWPVLSEKMGSQAMGGGEAVLPDPQMRGDTRYRAFRSGDWKLVESSRGEAFLYDLATDPGEESDLADAQPEALERMRGLLEETRVALQLPYLDADLGAAEAMPELDDATLERLRELGYVE